MPMGMGGSQNLNEHLSNKFELFTNIGGGGSIKEDGGESLYSMEMEQHPMQRAKDSLVSQQAGNGPTSQFF
jgi:hypothetical protein